MVADKFPIIIYYCFWLEWRGNLFLLFSDFRIQLRVDRSFVCFFSPRVLYTKKVSKVVLNHDRFTFHSNFPFSSFNQLCWQIYCSLIPVLRKISNFLLFQWEHVSNDKLLENYTHELQPHPFGGIVRISSPGSKSIPKNVSNSPGLFYISRVQT